MKNFFGNNGGYNKGNDRGGQRSGGKPTWRQDDRGGRGRGGDRRNDRGGDFGDSRPTMHPAICSDCNASCEVPFKPNGRKPVLCTNCHRANSDSYEQRPSYDKPSYSNKPAYEKPAYHSTPRGGTEEISKQLRILNEKMDEILEALMEAGQEAMGDEEDAS